MIDMDGHVQIETTFASKAEAEEMADRLLKERLIACGQWCEITSMFEWQGKRCKENEVLLKVKTQAVLYKDVEKLIKKHHKYETPQITVTGMSGSKEYLNWIDSSTRK